MNEPEKSTDLSRSSAELESQARELAQGWSSNPTNSLKQLSELISYVDASATIPDRERSRLVALFMQLMPLTRADQEHIASSTANLRGATKNAISGKLPQDLRPSLYRTKSPQIVAPAVIAECAAAFSTPAAETLPSNSASYAVVLIGTEQEHEANTALLKRHGITPLRTDVPARFEDIAKSEIAGVVVGGTAWNSLPPADHQGFVKKLLGFSSVLYLRIDLEGLDVSIASKLIEMREQICFEKADAAIFCHGTGCRLSPADISSIKLIAGLLSVSASTRFHPREIAPSEGTLVRVAANKHARSQQLNQDIRLEQIQTSFFSEGRSSAKVLLVRPDDGGPSFVLKIDKLTQLQDEMQKYLKYISKWEGKALPELHFHGQAAAVLFSLVDSPTASDAPAPTLDEELDRALNGELGAWGEPIPSESDLTTAVSRAMAKLKTLNSNPCFEKGYGYSWMLKTVQHLAAGGIKWQIQSHDGSPIDLPGLAESAIKTISKYENASVVHGDIHLKNILVRDRDPFFIDYGLSGPGHPCYDLIRLESALMFKCFRALCAEERIASCFHDIYVNGVDFAQLEIKYPDLLRSIGNRLSAKACIEARRHCLQILSTMGAGLDDYLAIKVLVSISALTMLQPQSVICRACLAGVWPHMVQISKSRKD